MSHNKHLAAGDPEPPPPGPGVLRVYAMKFCPFVHRLKLVLHFHGVDHETVNINTTTKPDWINNVNPRGKIPTIQRDKMILYESDITSYYIDNQYGGKNTLQTKEAEKLAKEQMLLGDLDQAVSGFFGYGRADNDEDRQKGIQKMTDSCMYLHLYLKEHRKSYICGKKVGMADFMYWPFLQKVGLRHLDVVKKQPLCYAYYQRMLEHETVKACRWPEELESRFWIGYFDNKPKYDIGRGGT